MKVHKMVCLDFEVVEKLKGENVSALVEKLLREHLEIVPLKAPETLEEARAALAKSERMLTELNIKKEAEAKIRELNNE